MLLRADSGMQKDSKIYSGPEDEFHVRRGDFIGTVQSRESKYEFAVRDVRREQPTIHGIGVDFDHAVIAVTQLLDALTGRA